LHYLVSNFFYNYYYEYQKSKNSKRGKKALRERGWFQRRLQIRGLKQGSRARDFAQNLQQPANAKLKDVVALMQTERQWGLYFISYHKIHIQ